MEPSDVEAALWPDSFEREYEVWGKKVVLHSLHNAEVAVLNRLLAQTPEEHKPQALAVLTIAQAIVSIDGKPFGVNPEGTPLSLEAKARIISGDGAASVGWHDMLTLAIQRRYAQLSMELTDLIEGLADPNASTGPEDSTSS